MSQVNPSWAVVATVDEPPALVMAFVAWHLHLGACEVHLYCDNPDHPVRAMVAHLPQVRVTPCDAAHWGKLGKSRPRRHQVRQVRNARDAYGRTSADWLAHIDADEFLWAGRPVAQTLVEAAPGCDGLIVRVAERMHRPQDRGRSVLEGGFRRPFNKPPKMGARIFGPDYALTYRGLTGHAQGKCFVPTKSALDLSIHRPSRRDGAEPVFDRADTDDLELLHFDGLTAAFWVYKLSRMQRALEKQDGMPPSAHRRAQADALIADPERGEALYRRLKVADAAMQAKLEDYDLWLAPGFDPSEAIARFFPDASADLSPAAMEHWLQRHKAGIAGYLRKARQEKGPPEGSP